MKTFLIIPVLSFIILSGCRNRGSQADHQMPHDTVVPHITAPVAARAAPYDPYFGALAAMAGAGSETDCVRLDTAVVQTTAQEQYEEDVLTGKEYTVRLRRYGGKGCRAAIIINNGYTDLTGRNTLETTAGAAGNPLCHLSIGETSFRKYTIGHHELLCCTASFYNCNGSGCGVLFYLIYDLKKKKLNAFSTFRMDEQNLLGDADKDGEPDFLTIAHSGWGTPDSFKMHLFTMNAAGDFKVRKDRAQQLYEIAGVQTDSGGHTLYRIYKLNWPHPVDTFSLNRRVY